jgi:hypothetical protein
VGNCVFVARFAIAGYFFGEKGDIYGIHILGSSANFTASIPFFFGKQMRA